MNQFNQLLEKKWFVPFIFGLLTVVLYGASLQFGFTQDDDIVLVKNQFVQDFDLANILFEDTFLGYFKEKKNLVSGGRYRPFSLIYFAVLNLISSSPKLFHFSSILLYFFSGILLFNFINRLKEVLPQVASSIQPLAFITALIWLVHPTHVEAVANIKGHDEIISVICLLLSGIFTLNWLKSNQLKHAILSAFFILIAILSKESAVVGLLMLPLIAWTKFKGQLLKISPLAICLAVISVIYFGLRASALDLFDSSTQAAIQTSNLLNFPFAQVSSESERIGTIFYSFLEYARLIFFPIELSHDYYPFAFEYQSITSLGALLGVSFIFLTVLLGLWIWKKMQWKEIALIAALIWIVPFIITSNLIFPIGTFMAERFLFLPTIGLIILIGITVSHFIKNSKIILGLVLLSTLLFSVRTFTRVPVWKDNFTLFQNDVKVVPGSAKVNNAAGGSAYDKYRALEAAGQGETEQAKSYLALAHQYLKQATTIYSDYADAYLTLGNTYFFYKNDVDSTIITYQKNGNLQALNNCIAVGNRLVVRKKFNDARKCFFAVEGFASKTDQKIEEAYELIINSFIEEGNFQAAVTVSDQLIAKSKLKSKLFTKKGLALGKGLGKLEEAKACFELAIQENPNNSEALENIGVVYAFTSNPRKAAEYFEKALQLNPTNQNLKRNLEAARSAFQ